MLFCQLAQAKSLREICGGLACCMGKLRHLGMKRTPDKSTLSYANAHQPWICSKTFFMKPFPLVNRRIQENVSSALEISCFLWTAAPSHCVYRFFLGQNFAGPKAPSNYIYCWITTGYLPTYVHISNGKKHDVTIARKISLAPGSIVAMDRGCNDYKLFAQ